MSNNSFSLQNLLFQKIASKANVSQKSLVKDVTSVLNLNSNVIYDRLNGKKLLNIEEVQKLALHYNISLDELIHSNLAIFKLDALEQQPNSFDAYLMLILNDLKVLGTIPNCEINYVASEMPFFYYLFYPEVALFKMYIWARTVWNISAYQGAQKFNIAAFKNSETLKNIEELKALYVKFPTTEYWNTNMLDTTINQIRYCFHCELFHDPKDAVELLEGIELTVDRLEETARTGQKSEQGQTILFHNELIQDSTLIMVDSPSTKAVYCVYDSPNFMISYSDSTFQHTYEYFTKIRKHCLPLNSEQQQLRFFKILRQKIKLVKEEFH